MVDVEALERRVTALEAAQNDTTQTLRWVVAKLGQMSAVQEQHSLRLERIEADVGEVKVDVRGLRSDLPAMLADAVREGIKGRNE